MKRFFVILICMVISFTFFACTENSGEKDDANKNKPETGKEVNDDKNSGGDEIKTPPADMLASLCEGVKVPAQDIFELNKSDFQEFSFIKWSGGIEAACAEGQISTSAHSLVLIKTKKGDGEKLAGDIADNADVRKWVCVQAKVGKVLYTDKHVLMIMSSEDVYQGLKKNFTSLMGTDKVNELNIKSSES